MYTWNGLGIVVIEPSGEKKEKFIRDFKACKKSLCSYSHPRVKTRLEACGWSYDRHE